MSVISLRLNEREQARLDELSRLADKSKSSVARELLDYGWEFLMLRSYKEGKVSLETLSKKLDRSISETIDLLSEQRIEAPLNYDDYLQGFEIFKEQ